MDSVSGTSTTAAPRQPEPVRCKHEQFEAKAHVHRKVSESWPFETSFKVELHVICRQCNRQFLFSDLKPTDGAHDGCSPDRLAALLNIKPPS